MNGISKFIGSSVCAGMLVFVAGQASANLVLNPGFETGDLTNWTVLGAGVGASVTASTPDNGPSAPGSFNAFMTNSIPAANLALQQSTALGDASPGLVNYSLDLKVVTSAVGGVVFIHIWDINSSGGVIDQATGLLGPYFNSSWATISGSFTHRRTSIISKSRLTARARRRRWQRRSMCDVDNVVTHTGRT